MPRRTGLKRRPDGGRKQGLAWRVAGLVREHLHQHQLGRLLPVSYSRNDLSTVIERWQKLSHQIGVASRRGWLAALSLLTIELNHLFAGIQQELDASRRILRDYQQVVLPSVRDLVADLQQLDDEFGDWRYDAGAGVLSVTTEPITLEGIALGSFAIKLKIKRLGEAARGGLYDVEALEPNPAEGKDGVTHPHVRDEELCEGEAMGAIRAALDQGRLADFFLLVNQVLHTYNPESPHVALNRWHGGISCHDCGCHVDDGDGSYCERCNGDYCQDCISCCTCCHDTRCSSCLTRCADCEELVCASCLDTCSACTRRVCEGCLEDGLCTSCREESKHESNDIESEDGVAGGNGNDHAAPTDNADAGPVSTAA